jgi:hypothetical protein
MVAWIVPFAAVEQRSQRRQPQTGDDRQETDQDEQPYTTNIPRHGLFIRLGDVYTPWLAFCCDGSTPLWLLLIPRGVPQHVLAARM